MSSESDVPNAAPPGMSGKKVTLTVLGLLIAIGGVLSYSLWSYGRLEAIRKDKLGAWAPLREKLADRYDLVIQGLANVPSTPAVDSWGAGFRTAVDIYQTTAQLTEQYDAAIEVEDDLANQPQSLPPCIASPDLVQAVAEFNAQLDRETNQLATPGCQLLGVFLSFRDPGRFELAE